MLKKYLLFLILTLGTVITVNAQLNYVPGSFKSSNAGDVKTGGESIGQYNMTSRLIDFQPSHNDEEIMCGLVRIKFRNMSNTDIRDNFKASADHGLFTSEYTTKEHPSPYIDNGGMLEYWFFVDPGKDIDLTLTHPTLGQVRIPGVDIESSKMYEAEIECEQRTTINFDSDLEGTIVTFDNKVIGEAPVKKENVLFGRYRVRYTRAGKTVEGIIDVSETQTLFKAQMREKCFVEFTTNMPGAEFYVDDERQGNLPITLELTEGPHVLRAKAQTGAYVEETINITPATKRYDVKVYKTKIVDLYALYGNSRVSGAAVYLNNVQKGTTPLTLELPYGNYKVRMSYNGQDKKGTLPVNENSRSDFSLAIPVRHHTFNPFEIEYRKREFGMAFSFIQKWYHLSYENSSTNLDAWGEEHKMSGLRLGVPIQPLFGYGFGLNTGLYCDIVMSFNDNDPGVDTDIMLTDVSLYLPVHLLYRLPLAQDFSIFVNGGIGLDLGLIQELSADGYDSVNLDYGTEGMQNRFNVAGEFGGGLQFKALQLSAGYSVGITNNKWFADTANTGIKTKINKWDFTLSILF